VSPIVLLFWYWNDYLVFCLVGVDLKAALGKKRRDGRSALPQPLTAMQRIHIGRLVDKYGDDYQVSYYIVIIRLFCFFVIVSSIEVGFLLLLLLCLQSMLMDIKLNPMQHSIGTLQKLCIRYHMYQHKNPLIVTK